MKQNIKSKLKMHKSVKNGLVQNRLCSFLYEVVIFFYYLRKIKAVHNFARFYNERKNKGGSALWNKG